MKISLIHLKISLIHLKISLIHLKISSNLYWIHLKMNRNSSLDLNIKIIVSDIHSHQRLRQNTITLDLDSKRRCTSGSDFHSKSLSSLKRITGITSFGKSLGISSGHTGNFCPNLVQYRLKICFKGITYPVFYGDLVYKLRRVKGAANFISSGSKIVLTTSKFKVWSSDPLEDDRSCVWSFQTRIREFSSGGGGTKIPRVTIKKCFNLQICKLYNELEYFLVSRNAFLI